MKTLYKDGKPVVLNGQVLQVNAEGGTDLSLAITGAAAGQIAKISAVDENGVPTAWEPVDMPSGGGGGTIQWIEVADITTTEQLNTITVNTDADGDPFSAYHAVAMAIALSIPADSTQTSASGSVSFFCANTTDPSQRAIFTLSSWKTVRRAYTIGVFGTKAATFFAGTVSTGVKTDLTFDGEVFDAARVFIQAAGDHFPVGTQFKVYLLSGGKA